jgi:hypothetical protein
MIIPAGDRSTEQEITLAVIACLHRTIGEASMKYLRAWLHSQIKLTDADREVSEERPSELKWHTVLRNIKAHAKQPGNAICDGKLVCIRGGGYALSEYIQQRAERERLQQQRYDARQRS